MIKRATKNHIAQLHLSQICEISCEINNWRCPIELKNLYPVCYYFLGNGKSVYDDDFWVKTKFKRFLFNAYLSEIRIYAELIAGRKEVLRHHNVIRRGAMNNQQFENWWHENKGKI